MTRKLFTLVALLMVVLLTARAEAQGRCAIAFPNLPDAKTLKCDFHLHTVFSDGNVWPTIRVDEAWRQGLDAIALTDHIEYHPHKDTVSVDLQRPYDIALRRANEYGLLLIRGGELTHDTPPGHHNALFLKDVAPLNLPDILAQFDAAVAQQAFVFWNHPGWQGEERGRWSDVQEQTYAKKQLHGIEICNGDEYFAEAHKTAEAKGLTLLGNTDSHDPIAELKKSPTEHRTLTLVFAKDRSIEAIHEALSAGRTAVWCQNKLYGHERELAPLYAASVKAHPAHFSDQDKVWVHLENLCELEIVLERIGQDGPAKLTLPALSAVNVRFDGLTDKLAAGLPYKATNFVTAPGKVLEVKLVVTKPEGEPAPKP